MMKQKQLKGFMVVLLLLATVMIIGCGKGDISGTYKLENNPDKELILYNNGKGLLYTTQFDYSVNEDTITVTSLEGKTEGKLSRKTITFEPSKDMFASFFTGTWKKK
jgi:hypothetical protein